MKYFIFAIVAIFTLQGYNNYKAWRKKQNAHVDKLKREFIKGITNAIEESRWETAKMKSGETPSEENIDLYFRMYLKKYELDNRDQWNTKPSMSYTEFKEKALNEGWTYLIGKTSDAFIGSRDGMSYQRFVDYKYMVKEEMKNGKIPENTNYVQEG